MRTCGKVSTYQAGCRCTECRAAAAAARAKIRGRTGTPKPDVDHGWYDQAACTDVDTALFFPRKGSDDRAKRVCAACPVRFECLVYAQRTKQADGVWGGLSAAERSRLPVVIVELPPIRFAHQDRKCAYENCEARFVPKRSNHRFCSDRCAHRVADRNYRRRRYNADPEYRAKTLARTRGYRAEVRDARLKKQRAYYAANRDALLARKRARYEANREAILQRQREWRAKEKAAA